MTRRLTPDAQDQDLAPTLEQLERGLRKLKAVLEGGPAGGTLEDALDVAHLSHQRWLEIGRQRDACRHLTRRQLGIRATGEDDYDALPPGSNERRLAAGLRTFLRLYAACILTNEDTLDGLAAALHHQVYGPDQAAADIVWQDYRALLVGRCDTPSVWVLREIAELTRAGVPQRDIPERVGVGIHQVELVTHFLGIKAWRQESRLRAATWAVENGLDADQFMLAFNGRVTGADRICRKTATRWLAKVAS